MRIVTLILISVIGVCGCGTEGEQPSPIVAHDFSTAEELEAYRLTEGGLWKPFSLPANTPLTILSDPAQLLPADHKHPVLLLQAVVADADSCWVAVNLRNALTTNNRLDSLRIEQTARILLNEEAAFSRFLAYRNALSGRVRRPLPFLLTEGDRLANLLIAGDAQHPGLLQSIEGLAGPILPGYRLILREAKPLLVRYWPYWEALAVNSAEEWHTDLIQVLRENYGKDSLADPLSLQWWVYLEDGKRYHRLGDTSTIERVQRLNQLVETHKSAFALGLDMTDQALRPLAAEGLEFWQGHADILWELDSILASDWSIVADRERIALHILRDQLLAPDTSGIRLDFRSGRFDY